MVVVVAFVLFFVGQLFVQLALGILGLLFSGEIGAAQVLLQSEPDVIAASAGLMRAAHITSQIFSWGFAAWGTASILGNPLDELQLSKSPSLLYWILGPVIIMCAAPLAQMLVIDKGWDGFAGMENMIASAREMEVRTEAVTKAILAQHTDGGLFINIITFALAPAVCEELFFRGLIQRNLLRACSPWLAILITATLFSLLHFMIFGFFARLFLGAVLGVIAWKADSVWPAILAHFTFNLFTILSMTYEWSFF